MRNYNYELAKKIVNTFNDLGVLVEASLGMQEDWFWTGETIFENGEFKKELNSETTISGITGSSWATPVIKLDLSNGEEEVFECFDGDWTTDIEFRMQKAKDWVNGCLSVPCQISFNNLEVKEFKQDNNE
jgi:hypothetical protein